MVEYIRKLKAPLALSLLLIPWVVGFDTPDSTGSYAKVSAGRGAYHITGCHRNFDSEFLEGNLSMQHRMKTGTPGEKGWRMFQPTHTTVGYFVDVLDEELTLVEKKPSDSLPDSLGSFHEKRAFGAGGYVGLDYQWIGVDLGLAFLRRASKVEDENVAEAKPIAGLRLGDADRFFISTEFFGGIPVFSGGALSNVGLGGKLGSTRAWVGLGSYHAGDSSDVTMGMLRLSHGWGPYTVSLAAQGSPQDVAPKGLGIDKEYGLSVGFTYRLPLH